MKGHLILKSAVKGEWREKFFVLQDGKLYIYKSNEASEEPEGSGQLIGMSVNLVPQSDTGRENCFQITFGFDSFVMQAASYNEMMDWACALYYGIAIANGGGYVLALERLAKKAGRTYKSQAARAIARMKSLPMLRDGRMTEEQVLALEDDYENGVVEDKGAHIVKLVLEGMVEAVINRSARSTETTDDREFEDDTLSQADLSRNVFKDTADDSLPMKSDLREVFKAFAKLDDHKVGYISAAQFIPIWRAATETKQDLYDEMLIFHTRFAVVLCLNQHFALSVFFRFDTKGKGFVKEEEFISGFLKVCKSASGETIYKNLQRFIAKEKEPYKVMI